LSSSSSRVKTRLIGRLHVMSGCASCPVPREVVSTEHLLTLLLPCYSSALVAFDFQRTLVHSLPHFTSFASCSLSFFTIFVIIILHYVSRFLHPVLSPSLLCTCHSHFIGISQHRKGNILASFDFFSNAVEPESPSYVAIEHVPLDLA
jgi:hypothetical protein